MLLVQFFGVSLQAVCGDLYIFESGGSAAQFGKEIFRVSACLLAFTEPAYIDMSPSSPSHPNISREKKLCNTSAFSCFTLSDFINLIHLIEALVICKRYKFNILFIPNYYLWISVFPAFSSIPRVIVVGFVFKKNNNKNPTPSSLGHVHLGFKSNYGYRYLYFYNNTDCVAQIAHVQSYRTFFLDLSDMFLNILLHMCPLFFFFLHAVL